MQMSLDEQIAQRQRTIPPWTWPTIVPSSSSIASIATSATSSSADTSNGYRIEYRDGRGRCVVATRVWHTGN
jgi:hypothetical protein